MKDPQLRRGLLEACVLAALCRGESHGYQIVKDLTPSVSISESTLYPVLRRLQKDGLLSTYDQPFSGRLRRYYALTDAGRDKLNEYRAEWKAYTLRVNSLLYGGNNDDVL